MSQDSSARAREPITVVIVDDHQIFRQGIEAYLDLIDDITAVGEGRNGEEALEIIRARQPDVALLDINLPVMNGMQVMREVAAERLPVRVVMLTAYDDPEQLLHAMRSGAAAYCPKEIELERLVEVVRLVMDGHYVVHDNVFDEEGIREWLERGVEQVAGQYYAELSETFSPLSPRESEILTYVTRGLSNKEIAQLLGISHQTVKNHMTSILRKLAVDDRTQAAVYALRRGWVRLRDTVQSSEDEFNDENEL